MVSCPTVFEARKILTMSPQRPWATHVAVKEGRILAVGGLEEMQGLGEYEFDRSFLSNVLMPGLVEGHSHLYEGGLWQFCYVGYYDRRGPDGTLWPGLKNLDAVVARLTEVERRMANPDEPLLAWGFDPIYFSNERMSERELDQVSTQRPVAIVHASFHLMNVNNAMLATAGIDEDSDVEGLVRHPDGRLTGELQEFAAMFPVNRAIGNAFKLGGTSKKGLENFASLAQIAGVTTATDLANELTDADVEAISNVTQDSGYPVRLVPAFCPSGGARGAEASIKKLKGAEAHNHTKLRFGLVKLILDGSIQGFTARLQWPGYHNGHANGIWVTSPNETMALVEAFHTSGLQLHIHTNGDEATEVALDAIENALKKHPQDDHRHTLQHVQMATVSQFRRMAKLGICANLFSNHIYYWGDAHYSLTMGPSRAAQMNACATAHREGVAYAMHSDAPITPLGPLFTAWCATNRVTASGRILGPRERISVDQALRAITLGAAYTLKMDDEIGSVEVGKRADFCVLEDDPLEVGRERLKDIGVWGTILGGSAFEAPRGE